MKTVKVLLTRHIDLSSHILSFVSSRGYTHASIGLEGDPYFYSFNYRGFCIETMEKHKKHGVRESLCYQVQVSEQAYAVLQNVIQRFRDCRSHFKYTRLGVFCCTFRVPFLWKNHYFCSQFVAELLHSSGAVRLNKPSYLYLPNQFCGEVEQCKGLIQTLYNVV